MSGFPGGASGKEPACKCRRCKRGRFISYPNMIDVQFCKKRTLTNQYPDERNSTVLWLLTETDFKWSIYCLWSNIILVPWKSSEIFVYVCVCVCVHTCVFQYNPETLFCISLFPQTIFPLSQSCFIRLFCSVFLILHFLVTEENISQSHGGIDLSVLFSTDAED